MPANNLLRQHALRIWQAAIDAVRSDRLVREAMRVEAGDLLIGDEPIPLKTIRRIAVVGAGKAGAGMAAGVEQVLGPSIMEEKQLAGWINVPADCAGAARRTDWQSVAHDSENRATLLRIHLHPARPAGVNEPMPEGVAGSEEILRLAGSLGPDDLCLCLISGGGSALMPAPAEGITLEDKLAVTRHLSAAGANIEELNTVRKQLSRIKGGGLARACRAGRLVALIISDVLGDPLDVIASGPTVEDSSTPAAALAVLEKFDARRAGISPSVFEYLNRGRSVDPARPSCRMANLIIGNNATAVDAAGAEAERLGYSHAMVCATRPEGPAEEVGRHLAEMALAMSTSQGDSPIFVERKLGQSPLGSIAGLDRPNCLISGGEPVVRLVEASRRGLGGRNQQLVLAALARLVDPRGAGCQPAGDQGPSATCSTGIALLSGGTDGEDGPTDAAGAVLDSEIMAAADRRGLDPADYLARNDAYHFFEPLGGLIKTGPTHTNVCDVRVVCVSRSPSPSGRGPG